MKKVIKPVLFLIFINLSLSVAAQNLLTPKELGKERDYRSLEDAFNKPLKVYKLYISNYRQPVLPREIAKLKNLQQLRLPGNHIKTFPTEIGRLKKLQYIDVSNSRYLNPRIAFKQFFKLKFLEKLDLSDNNWKTLPADIGKIQNLKTIDLSYNKNMNLQQIFSILGRNKYLEVIIMSECNIYRLPNNVLKLKNLKELHLSYNPIGKKEREKIRKMLPGVKVTF